ncbi:hypothetical protein IEQ34_001018 [Dendrobium chrysotoxum]|uniref:Uncharacterized protein n=1 Tax=Dendrobium chrysotoxum TaxID=161865 RepID=A0AAV7HQC5_DENCH|nr:hypothetical protein IEQ34_001018 [Dendrobium chrysotoxum]
MRDLPAPLYIKEEDIMRLLKVPNVEHLLYEMTSKVLEPPVPFPKAASKRQVGGEDPQVLLKKKKLEGAAVNTSKVVPVSSPVKIRVPGDVLSHQCVEAELMTWAQAIITQLREDQRTSGEKVVVLEAENKRSHTLIAEKEAALTSFESSRVIDDFKKSIAFKIIILDHVQEARDHIYERKIGVEVEGLTPSQASDDFPPSSDGDEIESELQKAFALEVDDEVVDIE